jgi:hypothetical protein
MLSEDKGRERGLIGKEAIAWLEKVTHGTAIH